MDCEACESGRLRSGLVTHQGINGYKMIKKNKSSKRKVLLFSSLVSSLLPFTGVGAGELVIDQNSRFSSLIVDVVTESKEFSVELEQGGVANNLEMVIDSALAGSISQVGQQGSIDLNSAGEAQSLSVSQAGIANTMGLELIGSVIDVVIEQSGNSNSIDYSADGDNNTGAIDQSGNDNKLVLNQLGSSNLANLVQSGSNNSMNISQYGGGLSLDITQIGNGDTLIIE